VTKDERFLIELYRATLASSAAEKIVDPSQIAKKLGYKENLTKEILKGLRQANFIKIYSPQEVLLTERGEEVARTLLA
jgi:Mn-dependent DtxR family transcriptional regulator